MKRGIVRGGKRAVGTLAIGVLLLASGSLVASDGGAFHTYLTGSVPAADSEVPMPVPELRLTFSTPVQRALSTITVTDPDGFSVPSAGVVRVPDSDDDELMVTFRDPLPEGRYLVRWRTAGPDDHPVQGEFSFLVVSGTPADRLDVAEGAIAQDTLPGDTTLAHLDHDTAAPPAPATAGTRGPAAAPGPAAGAAELQDIERTRFAVGPDARLQLGVRWLFYLAILGMIGTVVFRVGVVRPLSRAVEFEELASRALVRTRNLAWILGVLGLILLLPRLFLQSHAIFGGVRPGQLATVVFETTWGVAWLVQAFFTLLFLAGLLATGAGGRRSRGWSVMTVAALGLAFVPALSGHAWGAEEGRTIVVLSTFGHVFAGGVWLGGLLVLLFAGLPSLRRGARVAEVDEGEKPLRAGFTGLSSMVNAFSRLAILAVALLVGTGVVSAWIHLDAPGDLVATAYGRTLLVKVGVAAGALALGFYNWRVVRPSLRERQERGILRIPASLELFIGLLVLIVTAVLVSQGLP
jgi:copper transport protein